MIWNFALNRESNNIWHKPLWTKLLLYKYCHERTISTFIYLFIYRITLFRLILGDFNFNEMNDARPVTGPVFFVLYVFFIFFVLINMFLAIINDTYAEVKEDIEEQETEFALGDYFMKSYQKIKDRYSKKKKTIVDIQTALLEADTNQDNQVDYDEWRSRLKG